VIPDWQHGFLPKRGTLTAWRKILETTIKAKYIYEFDLKGFFDNVNVTGVLDYLYVQHGLAEKFRAQIEAFSRAPRISFASTKEEDQPKVGDPTLIPIHPLKLNAEDMKPGETVEMSLPLYDYEEAEEAALDALLSLPNGVGAKKGDNAKDWYLPTGFPQGANISPFLSITQLVMGKDPSFANLIMYADDGIFYSDSKFTATNVREFFLERGLEIAELKSGWVKEAKWLKPLKFLGLTYDGDLDRLAASTREGADLIFDKQDLVTSLASQPIV